MMMKFITRFSAIIVMLIFLQNHLVASLSPFHQKTALFQFKQSLTIGTPTDCYYLSSYDNNYYKIPSSPKTMNWSMSSDYCKWDGVSCDHKTGNVIGLDLSCSQLEGAILPNSPLFQLSHLQFLNLSNNDFSQSEQFPQEFGSFAKGLTHLNLSITGFTKFSGRVPSLGISHLYNLVSLDLSEVELKNEAFKSILQNLTQLRVLKLHVDTSSPLPQEVFHLPNIEVLALDVSNHDEVIWGTVGLPTVLPKVKWGSSGSLQQLLLSGLNIYGGIPDSIQFLGSLIILELKYCNLSGPIPRSIGNLGQLTYLGLSFNNLNDPIPTLLTNLTNLRYLDLYQNNFTGPFLSSVAHLKGLIKLDLGNNGFTGLLPTGLFDLPSLEELYLTNNGFRGQLYDFNSTKSQLKLISCRNNSLHGPIPQSFSQLVKLTDLDLPSNNFSGVMDIKVFSRLKSLQSLDLSSNNFSGILDMKLFSRLQSLKKLDLSSNNFNGVVDMKVFSRLESLEILYLYSNNFSGVLDMKMFSRLESLKRLDLSSNNFSGVLDMKVFSRLESLENLDLSHNSLLSVRSSNTTSIPPNLESLDLSSCNMKEFPHFSRDAEISLYWLDLSNNEIEGEIPHWIGSVGQYLNISHNRLTGGLEQLPWNNIWYLDLQSNKLNGSLSTMICDSDNLSVLNLSNNTLSGVLPICQTELSSLSVLDLRMNGIQGSLPSNFSNFRNLKSINLHGNKIEGRIPSSFAEFDKLETLDLGGNQINDTFPQCLEALPNLQVLVLKSNKFHGLMNLSSKIKHPFPSLRILDMSYNAFSGSLPAMYFKNFKAMMNGHMNETKPIYMGDEFYSDSTSLVIKGLEIEFTRILTVFTTIDVSMNNFEGEIGAYIGNLVSLRYLNLSYNHLTGHIPLEVGKLSMLESLDLSGNQLEGEIPPQLSSIYTLAHLNLSCNQLSGHIPRGSQFNTFNNDSYVGNLELCGFPLSKECEHNNVTHEEGEDEDNDYIFGGFTWEAVVMGYGCGVVPAFIIGNLMLLAGKPKWFAGIIARELGLKIRRMEIRVR